MPRTFALTVRRRNWLSTPTSLRKVSRSIQKATIGLVFKALASPLSAKPNKAIKTRKPTILKSAITLGVGRKVPASPVARPKLAAATKTQEHTLRSEALFQDRKHSGTAGTIDYKIYLPAGHPPALTGLILMLHGCTQTPEDFALGTHMNSWAEKHGLAIVYPYQTKNQNAASCWNWFKRSNQSRGAGEPALLASLAQKLGKRYKLGRENVFVAGFSAGGAMAAILADVYPDIFSAAGIHSGLARGSAKNVISAMNVMRNGGAGDSAIADTSSQAVRRIIFQSSADKTVHPSNADMLVASALGADTAPRKTTKRSVKGRAYTRSDFAGTDGAVQLELWMVEGAQHTWSGGRSAGTFTDTAGPDASAQMVRFFTAKSA